MMHKLLDFLKTSDPGLIILLGVWFAFAMVFVGAVLVALVWGPEAVRAVLH
jgi:hypothetical protein